MFLWIILLFYAKFPVGSLRDVAKMLPVSCNIKF